MALEILLGILYVLLGLVGTVLFLLALMVLLPVVVRVEAARDPDPESAPRIQACVGPWYGVVNLTLGQLVQGWEARLLLFGRFCVYRRLLDPASDDLEDKGLQEAGQAEKDRRAAGRTAATATETRRAATSVADTSVADPGPTDVLPTGPAGQPLAQTGAPTAEPSTGPASGAAAAPSSPDRPETSTTTSSEDDPSDAAAKPAQGPSLTERLKNGWRDVRTFLPPVRRLLRGLLRVVGLRRLEIDATLAGEDAAQTGLLYGRAQALMPFAPSWTRIRIDADFLRTTPYGQAKVHLHLYLARLLGSIGRFGLSAGRLWLMRWWRLRRAARTLSSSAMTERK